MNLATFGPQPWRIRNNLAVFRRTPKKASTGGRGDGFGYYGSAK